jgi:hypothetical protein
MIEKLVNSSLVLGSFLVAFGAVSFAGAILVSTMLETEGVNGVYIAGEACTINVNDKMSVLEMNQLFIDSCTTPHMERLKLNKGK